MKKINKTQRKRRQRGQTLVDAMIGIGLLGMVTLTLLQLPAITKMTTIHTQLIEDINQLYLLLSSIASTEPTCRIAFGGDTADPTNPPKIPQRPGIGDLSLNIYQSQSGAQVPLITPAPNPAAMTPTSTFGSLTVTSIYLTPTPEPSIPSTPGTIFYTAELTANVIPTVQNDFSKPRTLRGIFLTVALNATRDIISCAPITSLGFSSGNFSMTQNLSNMIPSSCAGNGPQGFFRAPTSYDGTTIQCGWTSCPSGYTAGQNQFGALNCTP